jgi:hypothetical protein
MTLQIIDCEQNSEAWMRARCGLPTASAFSDILAKGEGRTRRAYMMKLAGEIITGEPAESFASAHTERGHALEAEARDLYTFSTGHEPQIVGFITDGKKGCSPDSLIGDDGGLEIKTALPHILAEILLKNEVPTQHKAQIQGSMWVTGRAWWDVCIYWPKMPVFIRRVPREEGYIQTLATEVDRFRTELDQVVAEIRRRGEAVAA